MLYPPELQGQLIHLQGVEIALLPLFLSLELNFYDYFYNTCLQRPFYARMLHGATRGN